MDIVPSPTAPMFAADGSIAGNLECKRCGYNLRGLSEAHRCPECGAPVGLSASGDLLRFAEPEWVATLARGLSVLLWSYLFSIVGGIAMALARATIVAELIGLSTSLFALCGVWLLTTPDPGRIGEDRQLNARRIVRFTGIVAVIAATLTLSLRPLAFGAVAGRVLIALTLVATLIGVVGEFFKFKLYQQLAERVPNRQMARRAQFLRQGYVVTYGVLTLAGVVLTLLILPPWGGAGSAAAGATSQRGVSTGARSLSVSTSMPATVLTTGPAMGLIAVAGCLLAPSGIALIVFGVMTVFMLVRLRHDLRVQARLARETWVAATAPPTQ